MSHFLAEHQTCESLAISLGVETHLALAGAFTATQSAHRRLIAMNCLIRHLCKHTDEPESLEQSHVPPTG